MQQSSSDQSTSICSQLSRARFISLVTMLACLLLGSAFCIYFFKHVRAIEIQNTAINSISNYSKLIKSTTDFIDIDEKSSDRIISPLKNTATKISGWSHRYGYTYSKKALNKCHSTKAGKGGSGIGLAICKELIEDVLHGSISLQSQLGYRTTFTILLDKDLEKSKECLPNLLT